MYNKALLFRDYEIGNKILTVNSGSNHETMKEIRQCGRLVRNFNDDEWSKHRYSIMKKGLLLKFAQNKDLRDKLLSTGKSLIVEELIMIKFGDPGWM